MSKGLRNKQLDRMRSHPKDFSWNELVGALSKLGYEEIQKSGSRVCFLHRERRHKILLHKRHPDSTLLEYQIKIVLQSLHEQGRIDG